MSSPVPLYCGGVFLTTSSVIEVTNPFTGKIIAHASSAGAKEVNDAIDAALQARAQMKALPAFAKYRILSHLSQKIREKREELAALVASEAGKPYQYALLETDRASATALIAAEESKRLPREYMTLDGFESGANREALVKGFPAGIVAGITPFNFPLNLVMHKLAPAIAAGCPIIIKPASATPLSCLRLAEILDETELPKGAFSVLPCDRETGNLLVTDERISLLSFTGSPTVGWKMKSAAGKKKVVLELGGNAGVIVTRSADLMHALKRCLYGSFVYSGQVCIHVQRIYVDQHIFRQFTEEFCRLVNKLKYGDPLDKETMISSMIDEQNAGRVEEWVNEAVASGATILCGGKREGSYYSPTVLTGTKPDMKVCAEEVFGPVVLIEPYQSFPDAVKMINETKFGLQAGVFTNEIKELDLAFAEIEAGGIIHNDVPTYRADEMPYGGVKESGLGREGVKYAIMDMIELRTLVRSYSA